MRRSKLGVSWGTDKRGVEGREQEEGVLWLEYKKKLKNNVKKDINVRVGL